MSEMPDDLDLIRCPICHGKTRTRVLADTVLQNYPLFCPKCKQTCIVDVRDNKITQLHNKSEIPANLFWVD